MEKERRGRGEKGEKNGEKKPTEKGTEEPRGLESIRIGKRFNVWCPRGARGEADEQNRADVSIYVNSLSTGC